MGVGGVYMPRITKCRRICVEPTSKVFKPECISNEQIILQLEELESLRLIDFENLDQDAAAKRMSVSRGTFQRILYSARHKVAQVLIQGKNLVIEGGNYEVSHTKCDQGKVCSECKFVNE